jgi:exopolysaccharide biosynthesis polyprenyl glycosylphosphotransferase
MKNNGPFLYRLSLALGDSFALLLSFTAAYILRVSIDSRPITSEIDSLQFISYIIALLPFWIFILYSLGLYSREIYEYRPKEFGRLLIVAAFGILIMIGFSFFTSTPIFPAKLVPVYAFGISFVLLISIRTIIKHIRLRLLDHGYGTLNMVIVGNSPATLSLSEYVNENPRSGYVVTGIVANNAYILPGLKSKKFSSLALALKNSRPDVIIQTDTRDQEENYKLAINHHASYSYVSEHQALSSSRNSIEILGTLPITNVSTTPLIGHGRALKRIVDIIMGSLILLVALPFMLVIAIIVKLTEPRAPIFFKQQRLSRFNRPVYIYKFRTVKLRFNGMSPEEAFEKMGKPELSKQYRDNGDQLEKDPRITRFGRFLRASSLDEFPQLINVVRGDISLVGPRVLMPAELNQYPNKSLILSVKSGLTGLAQVSGRRNISFEDRRALDIYYVQNWTLLLDLQILLKTAYYVLLQRGAK